MKQLVVRQRDSLGELSALERARAHWNVTYCHHLHAPQLRVGALLQSREGGPVNCQQLRDWRFWVISAEVSLALQNLPGLLRAAMPVLMH